MRTELRPWTTPPAPRFRLVPDLSTKDYADASQKKGVVIRRLSGWLGGARPITSLVDGRWPKLGSANNQLVASTNETTVLRVDFPELINVGQISTYTAHDTYNHTSQKYTVYYSAADKAPPHKGNPEAHGWIKLADVETPGRDGCRGVCIFDPFDEHLAECRFLLFVMDLAEGSAYTNFAELDIHLAPGAGAVPIPEPAVVGLAAGLARFAARKRRR